MSRFGKLMEAVFTIALVTRMAATAAAGDPPPPGAAPLKTAPSDANEQGSDFSPVKEPLLMVFRPMHHRALVLAGLLLLPVQEPPSFRGFSPASGRAQVELERRFRAMPVPDSIRSYLRRLSARPQHLGSPYGKANADWVRSRFEAWGWQAAIEEFEVLFPTPKERILELVAP